MAQIKKIQALLSGKTENEITISLADIIREVGELSKSYKKKSAYFNNQDPFYTNCSKCGYIPIELNHNGMAVGSQEEIDLTRAEEYSVVLDKITGGVVAPENRTTIRQTQKGTSKKVNAKEDDDFDYSNKEFKKRIIITGVNSKPKIKPTMNLFTFSYNFLKGIVRDYWNNLSQNPYTDKAADAIIEGYLTTPNSTNDLNGVFKELCSSLQTSSRLNNVIGFYNVVRNAGISRALFDFDVQRVANLESYECVLRNLKNNLTGLNINFGNSWELYAKGVYSGAKFITHFSSYNELIERLKHFEDYPNNHRHLKFPEYQLKCSKGEYKIVLMGEVIALNWMKEIGINNGKPDTHILDVFVECELLHSGNRNALVSDCESLLEEKAESYGLNKRYNSFGVYALDKVIWLCCSGHFYRHLNKKYNLKNYRIPNGVSISDSGWKNLKKKYLVEMMIAINNGKLKI